MLINTRKAVYRRLGYYKIDIVMLNKRTLIEKAARSQDVPGEVGAAAYAIPKRMLKVKVV